MQRLIPLALIQLLTLTAAQPGIAWMQKSSPHSITLPERNRALTISGSIEAVTKALESLSSKPHSWEAFPMKRESNIASIRLRWPKQPNYRDLGVIIYTAQLNGLKITDTDLIAQ